MLMFTSPLQCCVNVLLPDMKPEVSVKLEILRVDSEWVYVFIITVGNVFRFYQYKDHKSGRLLHAGT